MWNEIKNLVYVPAKDYFLFLKIQSAIIGFETSDSWVFMEGWGGIRASCNALDSIYGGILPWAEVRTGGFGWLSFLSTGGKGRLEQRRRRE